MIGATVLSVAGVIGQNCVTLLLSIRKLLGLRKFNFRLGRMLPHLSNFQMKTIMEGRTLRPVYSCSFVPFISFLFVFGAQTTFAQTPVLPQRTLQQPTVQKGSVTAVYCKQSTLTGPAFLSVLNSIIKYGDLTDISFLQKMLGTKLDLSYGRGTDGKEYDHQHLEYNGDQVLGSPIHVHVDVHLDVIKGEASPFNGVIADIRFGSTSINLDNPIFMRDCMKLADDNFFSFFGGGFRESIYGGATKLLTIPGKNHTHIMIGIEVDYPKSQFVREIVINEAK